MPQILAPLTLNVQMEKLETHGKVVLDKAAFESAAQMTIFLAKTFPKMEKNFDVSVIVHILED